MYISQLELETHEEKHRRITKAKEYIARVFLHRVENNNIWALQKLFTYKIKFQIHLLWHQSKASGFITIRPYSEAFEDSNLSIIDTVYIQKSARGHGFLSKFLEAKLNNNDDDDSNELGFSDPISNSMLIVLMKLLKKNPNQRERIWLVNEENGERQILWWSAMKIARQRNIDLKSILKWTLN